MVGVTAENFIIRAARFEDATGKAVEYAKAAGGCFMMTNAMHQQRAAWTRYFYARDMVKRVREMRWWLEEKGQYAVPAEWPWLFDAEWQVEG